MEDPADQPMIGHREGDRRPGLTAWVLPAVVTAGGIGTIVLDVAAGAGQAWFAAGCFLISIGLATTVFNFAAIARGRRARVLRSAGVSVGLLVLIGATLLWTVLAALFG